MAAKRQNRKAATSQPSKTKVKFLVVLPADAIKYLKLEAIERSTTASSVLEEAVRAWMKGRKDSALTPHTKAKGPTSEKRQFLSQMDAALVRELKILALDRHTTASALVTDAIANWLTER